MTITNPGVTTPVAFFVFNRPDVTQRVFDCIRNVRPRTLLVIGDAAREHKPGELCLVEETQKIIEQVDWNCDLRVNFASVNLGCKRRVSTGLDWVFQQFEQAIFLEDDCLPDPSFFPYCDDLLDRYRDDSRVFSISGDNFQNGRSRSSNGYYFSKYFHCWGWATWRRVWQSIDLSISRWPQFVNQGGLNRLVDDPDEATYWERVLNQQYQGATDSWAYSWLANCWMSGSLNILPDVNLVSNIGFTKSATHTRQSHSKLANIPTQNLSQWTDPGQVQRHIQADRYTFQNVYRRPNRWRRMTNKIVKQWNRWRSRSAA